MSMGRVPSRVALLDRGQTEVAVSSAAAEAELQVQLLTYGSALELIGEAGPREVDGLAISVESAGPFLPEVLRWADQLSFRVPTLLVGSGQEAADEEASRQILGRDQIRWVEPDRPSDDIERWLVLVAEVKELRAYRGQHELVAQELRRARLALFHGLSTDPRMTSEGPPCGPPLPTHREEIEPLKEARARFERAHIRAVLRDQDSLKEASQALGISYTSLWRRLR